MTQIPFALEPAEKLLAGKEIQIVPDGGSPQTGRFWLTDRRIVARWEASAGLLRQKASHEMAMALVDVADTRLPGGPLVQIVTHDGRRLSFQSFQPLLLRQQIAEAVLHAQGPSPHASDGGSVADADREESSDELAGDTEAQCPRCGAAGPHDARFCAHCGDYHRVRAAYCRRCDCDHPPHYRFCVQCGEPLVTAESAREPRNQGIGRR